MALSIAELHALVAENLADASNILPSEHRQVEDEIINYLATTVTSPSDFVRTKVIIGGWSINNGCTVNTTLGIGKTILAIIPTLICKVANNGYSIGDIVNISPAQANDSGGLADSGITVRWRTDDSTKFTFHVNDRLDVCSPYNGGVGTCGAIGNPIDATSANWDIRNVIIYL